MVVIFVSSVTADDRRCYEILPPISVDDGCIVWAALTGAPSVEVLTIHSIPLRKIVIPFLSLVLGVESSVAINYWVLSRRLKELLA